MSEQEATKTCTKCSETKPLSEFAKASDKRQGVRSHCKACCIEYVKRYKEEGSQSKGLFISDTEKLCTQCDKVKPLKEFWRKGDAYQPRCKDCFRAYRLRNSVKEGIRSREKYERLKQDSVRYAHYQEKNRHRQRHRDSQHPYTIAKRLKSYELTLDEYNTMIERQNGACAICGKAETVRDQKGRIRALAIDHDHVTGKVRGLLCFRCNTDLGRFESQAAIFQSYLSQ